MPGLSHAEMTALLSALVSPEPAERNHACGTVTDWIRAFDRFQVRTVAAVLATVAVGETDPVCRETQLHALFELISTGHLSRAWFEPVLHLDEGTLDPGEREYLAELRELG